MIEMFVTEKSGYINGWYDDKVLTSKKVQTKEELVGILDCIKVENGIAVLDEEKQKELISSADQPTDIEQLQAGLAQASFQVMQSTKQIEELNKQNAAMGFKIMQLEQNQNTESGVN